MFNNTNSQELVGKTAYFDLSGNCLCSNHITRIMVDKNRILPQYLWVVLNIYQQEKVFFNICTNWNNQSGVNIDLLKTLAIPVPNTETQAQIVEIITTAYQQKQQKEKEAQKLIDSIDDYVLRELGITMPEVKNEMTFTAYSDDIKDKRIDPYYYQNSFTTLSNLLTDIKTYKLKDLITDLTGGATPKVTENFYLENNGIPFLRVQNITKQGISLEDVKYIKPEVHENLLKRSQLKKDDIVFTITGRIGSVAVVPENFTGNINQHSVRFHLKNSINDVFVLPEYIAIFFNTNLGNMLSLRNITGGTRPALDYEAIKNLIIPLPSIDIQKKIIHEVHTKIKQSINLRTEAFEDLEQAKKQVEEMILSGN